MKDIFCPADILIPADVDMQKWSVVACDQFTSEPEYWEQAVSLTEGAPSALRLMLPEAWLERPESENAGERIAAEMSRYLSAGLFRELK
ncbi:MAG: DUF1015 family protein, partial [Eubacteriales bacterium]|nr:DUF1015 family protein [Eubacteriales bacterium]